MPGASDTGAKGAYEGSRPDALGSRPTINLFELWENGSHVVAIIVSRSLWLSHVHGFNPLNPCH